MDDLDAGEIDREVYKDGARGTTLCLARKIVLAIIIIAAVATAALAQPHPAGEDRLLPVRVAAERLDLRVALNSRREGMTPGTESSITTTDGRVVQGWYRVHDGMVTVSTAFGRQTTQIGGSPPEVLARRLLRKLVAKGLDKPD